MTGKASLSLLELLEFTELLLDGFTDELLDLAELLLDIAEELLLLALLELLT
jgi:hypothetical protein